VIFGPPLASEEAEGEKVGPWRAIPILGLDALASAAALHSRQPVRDRLRRITIQA
jgi:hypothetical protein